MPYCHQDVLSGPRLSLPRVGLYPGLGFVPQLHVQIALSVDANLRFLVADRLGVVTPTWNSIERRPHYLSVNYSELDLRPRSRTGWRFPPSGL